eukprot:TRINITY_DN2369_c0_g1_i1.p1 TRINITY_DN2369_c0_g1~~TRINITY_DN2369_c0_g1_i1.p1  ORF type:complete len:443 (+),score=149.67 TRINITY_DN2369_c0_g1_i1:173-1501(+)
MTISESGLGNSSTSSHSPPSTSASMLSAMSDRYITPEYLAPLPSSEKTGKSPLQLLAQTCSQIGADPVGNKLLNEKNNNSKDHSSLAYSHHPSLGHYEHPDLLKKSSSNRSPVLVVSDPPKPVSFKPYESSSSSSSSKAPSPKVVSLSPEARSPPKNKSTRSSPASNPSSAASKVSPIPSSALPMIRSGMEILSGAKDYANPAFRPSFGVCRDPYCRDPTCPTAIYNAQLASALAGLPLGYAELLQAHQKFSMIPGFPSPPGSSLGGSNTTSSPPAPSAAVSSPYVCNWMNGRDGYCGKRHSSAEELLHHLKTHTSLSSSSINNNNSSSSASTSSGGESSSSSLYPSLLNPLQTHHPGRNSSSSSNSSSNSSSASSTSSRYMPYTKPGSSSAPLAPPASGIPQLFGGIPPGLAGFPPSLLSGAYSPSSLYALYGSRLAGSLP